MKVLQLNDSLFLVILPAWMKSTATPTVPFRSSHFIWPINPADTGDGASLLSASPSCHQFMIKYFFPLPPSWEKKKDKDISFSDGIQSQNVPVLNKIVWSHLCFVYFLFTKYKSWINILQVWRFINFSRSCTVLGINLEGYDKKELFWAVDLLFQKRATYFCWLLWVW